MSQHLSIVLLLSVTAGVSAQTFSASLQPPIAVEQIVYRHWPEQFVQWIGPELPYSMIELYVDPTAGPTPLYDAVLTERAGGKRVHYSNQQEMVDIDKRMGAEAYRTQIQLDRPASAATGATYLVRFTDHAGEPVSWQFIQGSDITERGGGASPASATPPVLIYRERSAVAGEGSAVKIGNAVSTADLWKEISQPPYFVAYHGALSQNVELAVFAGADQEWTVVQAPPSLAAGAAWKLKAADGLACTLQVQSVKADVTTVTETDEHLPGRTITIEARGSGAGWSIERIHYGASAEHTGDGLSISFNPGMGAATVSSKFEVLAGHKTRIANGTVHLDAAQQRTVWEFKDPEWLRGKTASLGSVTVQQKQTGTRAAAK